MFVVLSLSQLLFVPTCMSLFTVEALQILRALYQKKNLYSDVKEIIKPESWNFVALPAWSIEHISNILAQF